VKIAAEGLPERLARKGAEPLYAVYGEEPLGVRGELRCFHAMCAQLGIKASDL